MPATIQSSGHFLSAVRLLGPRWFVTRMGIALRRHCGVYEWQCPAGSPESAALPAGMLTPRAELCRVSAEQRAVGETCFPLWDADAPSPVVAADAILAGRFPYFGHATADLGNSPDWFVNPFSGERAPEGRHWSRIGDFDYGDIKVIWEPSRFGWTFPLVRAYHRTADERYAAGFWQLFENWIAANPLNRGANWMCGQEASFRLIALSFALSAFSGAQASTPERERRLQQGVAESAERIATTLNYALSQRNNHGISEAAALWTAGLLLSAHPRAAKWKALGRRHLESQVRTLIDGDGAFSQHSTNYQRVMLHTCVWALRIGGLAGEPLSSGLRARIGLAADLLYQLQDEATGRLPRYGQQDGALVLPLSNSEPDDFRPVIQSARYMAYGTRTYAAGPWDEELYWMGGADALKAKLDAPVRTDLAAHCSGYYTLRTAESFAFLRCGKYLHRPGQADMLHVDLHWRGINVALDAGTYSYNAPAPFDQAFFGAEFHNTVTVDGQQPMDRVGRFLWLPWERGELQSDARFSHGQFAALVTERDGYRRLASPVNHRRLLLKLGAESWLIVDRLSATASHAYRLHWLLEDFPHEWQAARGRLELQTPAGPYTLCTGTLADPGRASLVRADNASARGWQSKHYLERSPALSLALDVEAQSVVFWSLFSPHDVAQTQDESGMTLAGEHWTARLQNAETTGQAIHIDVLSQGTEGESLHVAL